MRKRKIMPLAAGLALAGWRICFPEGSDDLTARRGEGIVVMGPTGVKVFRRGDETVVVNQFGPTASMKRVLRTAEAVAGG